VGKSAVARVLGGLWQPKAGKVGRPLNLIVIPQLPLVPTLALSLLDTMTYPLQLKHGSAEESDAIVTLLPLLQKLRIGYLIDRSSDGWHAVSAWDTVPTPANQSTFSIRSVSICPDCVSACDAFITI
jgi:ABC-type uncharacterized transport system fused permease/ATPase subunit